MQIQACPLIVSLLAVLSYLPAATTATNRFASTRSAGGVPIFHVPPKEAATKKISRFPPRQQPNTVNIRPRVAAAQQGVPSVQITVDKSRVPVNETVVFTLAPASVVSDARNVVTIDFGDGSRSVTRQTEIVHQYGAPGIYTVKVLVKPPGPGPNPTPDPRVPRVSLTATPTTVEAERPVNFIARLSFPYPNIKYRFSFGDKSQTDWQDDPQTTHEYLSAGTYPAYVDIGVSSKGTVRQMGGSTRQPIQVTQPPIGAVDLVADPTEVAAGGIVTFTALVPSKDPNLTFRFFFGDGSPPSLWQANRQTTHKYLLAGRYPAYVEVGRNGKGPSLANSVVRQVSVTSNVVTPTPTPQRVTPSPVVTPTRSPGPSSPSPGGTSSPGAGGITNSPDGGPIGPLGSTNNWWWWLLLLALALIAAYQAVKMYLASQLTFRPVVDTGVTHFEHGAEPLGINFEMVLSPNVSEGQYGLETDETRFIRSERSSNG
jgi:PKD repeat protein